MSSTRTYPHGVTSWIDVEVGDLALAQEFYGGLFGWSFERATPPDSPYNYVIARLEGLDVAGLGGPAEPTDETAIGWNTYVAVEDIEAAAAAVGAGGGQVTRAPEAAGEGGWSAVCTDPDGVSFRLWQARRRLGVQVANLPGSWNFSDLHSADPASSRSFYEQVFGWVFADLGPATMIQVPGYGDHLAATSDPDIHARQAGAPPGFADVIGVLAPADDLGPRWQVTFTVADREETTRTAESLGATVLASTEDDWTRKVVLRDPQGAVFTASQFTPPG